MATFPLAWWPRFGHYSHMHRSSKTPANEEKRHKIYGPPEVLEAFDKLCKLERKSRSQLVFQLLRARLRQKAPVLRKAGVVIPEEVFTR